MLEVHCSQKGMFGLETIHTDQSFIYIDHPIHKCEGGDGLVFNNGSKLHQKHNLFTNGLVCFGGEHKQEHMALSFWHNEVTRFKEPTKSPRKVSQHKFEKLLHLIRLATASSENGQHGGHDLEIHRLKPKTKASGTFTIFHS